MTMIEFSKEEKETIIEKIGRYFLEELGQEIGQFDAEFLLEFFMRELGVHFYNRGLHDAQTILQMRLDSLIEAIYELEKPVGTND